jgi:hypothetical protein
MIIQKTSASESILSIKTIFHSEQLSDHMVVCEYENGKWGDVNYALWSVSFYSSYDGSKLWTGLL